MNGYCNSIGCKNPVKWIVGGQWYACDDHVDDMVKELKEHVSFYIEKRAIMEQGHVCTCKDGCSNAPVIDMLDALMDDIVFIDGAGVDDKGQPLIRLADVQKTIIRRKLESQKVNITPR